jgi:hypothetical protein
MPTFSPDPVVDFCVAEAVVRAGEEAERIAGEEAQAEDERKEITSGHKEWAEQLNLLPE